MPEFRRNALDQTRADPLDVVVHAVVAQDRQLLLDLSGRFAAGLHVFLNAVFVVGRDDLRLAEDHRHRREQRDGRCGRARGVMVLKS